MDRIGQAWSTAKEALKSCAAETRWYYFGSSLLVAIVTLTHYANGYRTTAIGLSYADIICATSIAVATLALAGFDSHALDRLRKPILLTSSLVAALGFVFLRTATVALPELYDAALIVSAVSVGLLIGTVAIFWFGLFVGQAVETVAFSLLVSIAIGCLISWFLLGMFWDWLVVGYTAVILLSGWTLSHALD